jgi:hypothetical protein
MRTMIIRIRWLLVRSFLKFARLLAVKDCDYGDRVIIAVDGFFFYTSHGYMPRPSRQQGK